MFGHKDIWQALGRWEKDLPDFQKFGRVFEHFQEFWFKCSYVYNLKQTRQKKLGHHQVSDPQSLTAATRVEQSYMLTSSISTELLLPRNTTGNMGRECCGLNGSYIPIPVLPYNELFLVRCTWNLLRHWALFIDQITCFIIKIVNLFFLTETSVCIFECINLHLVGIWVWGFLVWWGR